MARTNYVKITHIHPLKMKSEVTTDVVTILEIIQHFVLELQEPYNHTIPLVHTEKDETIK